MFKIPYAKEDSAAKKTAMEIKVGDIISFNGKYTYLVFERKEGHISLYTINNATDPHFAGTIINDYKLINLYNSAEWRKVE